MQIRLPSLLYESLAEIPEHELVDRLLGDPYWRESLFGVHGIPDAPQFRKRVLLQNAPGNYDGDADIVLCAVPSLATAIEVKRIKVGPKAKAFDTGKPNKLAEFEKGVRQANQLADVGFAQVYLYVLVVVDSRIHNNGKYTYDGLTPDLHAAIETVVSTQDLKPRVGLMLHKFVQPMDHAPFGVCAAGSSLKRLATEVQQPPDLTKWIAHLFTGRGTKL